MWFLGFRNGFSDNDTKYQWAINATAHDPNPPITIETPTAFTHASDTGAFALTGVAATFAFDRTLAAASGGYALTGSTSALAFNHKLAAAAAVYTITGSTAALAFNRKLTAASGAFALTGVAATLAFDRTLAAASGVFAITGSAAALAFNRKLSAASAAYALTGIATALALDRRLAAASGVYTFNGQDAVLQGPGQTSHVSDTGSYALTGSTTALAFDRTLVAATAAYAITGSAATLAFNRKLAAATAAYALTGSAATLAFNRKPVEASGAYALTGSATALAFNRTLVAASAVYTFTGRVVILKVSHKLSASTGAYVFSFVTRQEHISAVGQYSVTGRSAILKISRKLVAATGVYPLSGRATTLHLTRLHASGRGQYFIVTTLAGTVRTRKHIDALGVYGVTGRNTVLSLTRRHAGIVGSYAFTEGFTTPQLTRELFGAVGAYDFVGRSTEFVLVRRHDSMLGVYTIVGTPDQPAVSLGLYGGSGQYGLMGQEATLRYYSVFDQWIAVVNDRLSAGLELDEVRCHRRRRRVPQNYRHVSNYGVYRCIGRVGALSATRKLAADVGGYAAAGGEMSLVFARSPVTETGVYIFSGNGAGLQAAGRFIHTSTTAAYGLIGAAASIRFIRRLAAGTAGYGLTGRAAQLVYRHTHASTTATYGLTGASASVVCSRKLAAGAAGYAFVGRAGQLHIGYRHTSNAGVYVVSGGAMSLVPGRRVAASTGAYGFNGNGAGLQAAGRFIHSSAVGQYLSTGRTAGIKFNRKLVAGVGSYSHTGRAAQLVYRHTHTSTTATYGLAGVAASILLTRKLSAGTGVYAPVGSASTLTMGHKLSAAIGGYALNGNTAVFQAAGRFIFSSDTGQYLSTGRSAVIKVNRKLVAGTGAYGVTGRIGTLREARKLSATAGGYALTGKTAALLGPTEAPLNLVPPQLFGIGQVGRMLTWDNGSWANVPLVTFASQLKRNGVAIAGATSSPYLMTLADMGQQLTVTVTATTAVGSTMASSVVAPFGIYQTTLAGGACTLLLSDATHEINHANESSDGRYLAYVKYYLINSGANAIEGASYLDTELLTYRMSDGLVEVRVPHDSRFVAANPSWNADARSFLYITSNTPNSRVGIGQYSVITNTSSILYNPSDINVSDPHPSSDGNFVVMSGDTSIGGGQHRSFLYIYDVNTHVRTQLTSPTLPNLVGLPSGDFDAHISHDRTKVAAIRLVAQNYFQIVIITLGPAPGYANLGERLITTVGSPSAFFGVPIWSSDDRKILTWLTDRENRAGDGAVSMNPDGTGQTRLALQPQLHINTSSFTPTGGSLATAIIHFSGQSLPIFPALPVSTSPPIIPAGTPQVGVPLTASPGTYANTTSGPFGEQWKAAGIAATGAGATSLTYTPAPADAGKTLTIAEVGKNSGGWSIPPTSSAATAVVIGSSGRVGAPYPGQSGNLVGHTNAPGYPGVLTPMSVSLPGVANGTLGNPTIVSFKDIDGGTAGIYLDSSRQYIRFFGCRFQSNSTGSANVSTAGAVGIEWDWCTESPRVALVTAPPNAAWPSAGAGHGSVQTAPPTVYQIPAAKGYQYGLNLSTSGAGGPYTITNCDIWGGQNLIALYGTTTQITVYNTWFHDFPDQGGPDNDPNNAHQDVIGYLNAGVGPTNVIANHNTIAGIANGNLFAWQGGSPSGNFMSLDDNFFSGGAVPIFLGGVRNTAFTHNVMGTDLPYRYAIVHSDYSAPFRTNGNSWSGNKIRVLAGTVPYPGSVPQWTSGQDGFFIWPDGTLHATDFVP